MPLFGAPSAQRGVPEATAAEATLTEEERRLLAEFDALLDYLRRAPLPPEHPACRAALEGLDWERQRLRRDWRLREKFRRAAETAAPAPPHSDASSVPQRTDQAAASGDAMEDDTDGRPGAATGRAADHATAAATDGDWQDVAQDAGPYEGDPSHAATTDGSGGSALGVSLAREAVQALAQSQVRVTTPLQALVVALHAALRGPTLGFVGTTTAAAGPQQGFAAPVRELPRDQWLPAEFWDQTRGPSADRVVLRYRKEGLGAVLLQVEQVAAEPRVGPPDVPRICLSLHPESHHQSHDLRWMEFDLDRHVNLESFRWAAAARPSVEPALHYKALAQLLTNLCTSFDIGIVQDSATMARGDASIAINDNGTSGTRNTGIPVSVSGVEPSTGSVPCEPPHRVPATVGQAFPSVPRGIGPFDGDLYPNVDSIIGRDRIEPIPGIGPGNLLGPNHPMWDPMGGRPVHRIGPIGGPGTMQPRYDPIGPPLGPTDPNNDDFDVFRRRAPSRPALPGGTGVPNDSLLQPPNNLDPSNALSRSNNSNMFM